MCYTPLDQGSVLIARPHTTAVADTKTTRSCPSQKLRYLRLPTYVSSDISNIMLDKELSSDIIKIIKLIQENTMSRIRLNQEYRNKVANRMRVHIEQENTQEKEKFFQCRENFKDHQDKTWELAKECVSRQYPQKDVDMAHYLQDKYPNVNTIAKDSCFHFGYMAKKGGEIEDTSRSWSAEHHEQDDKYISKHFDFRLNGDIDGVDRQDDEQSYRPSSRDFGYAYFRDELKAQKDCNPDITIEMEGKEGNPHWTKFQDANDRYLGTSSGKNNLTSYADKWDK